MNQRLAGNTSRPVHTNILVLRELKQETLLRSLELGTVCGRMLHDPRQVDLKEVAEQIRGDHAVCPSLPDMSYDVTSMSQGTTTASATPSTHAPSSTSDKMSQMACLADLIISPTKSTERTTICSPRAA